MADGSATLPLLPTDASDDPGATSGIPSTAVTGNSSQVQHRLHGKVALVTGAASPAGFGCAIAKKFLAHGASVVIADIHPSVTDLAKELGSRCHAHKLDVTSGESWQEALKTTLDTFGHLDILVNNAGTTYSNKPTTKVTEQEYDACFDVNVKSLYHAVTVCIPQMQKQGKGGVMINIASIGSVRPRPGLVWYNASKGAVSNATKALAAEFGADQIRVVALCPLLSATGLFSKFTGVEDTDENRKKFLGNVPMGRLSVPDDVANAALFLASDEGSFITGVNLEIDGGRQWGG